MSHVGHPGFELTWLVPSVKSYGTRSSRDSEPQAQDILDPREDLSHVCAAACKLNRKI